MHDRHDAAHNVGFRPHGDSARGQLDELIPMEWGLVGAGERASGGWVDCASPAVLKGCVGDGTIYSCGLWCVLLDASYHFPRSVAFASSESR